MFNIVVVQMVCDNNGQWVIILSTLVGIRVGVGWCNYLVLGL